MLETDVLDLIATLAVGFAATFVFVTTGGVGMITIPALIFLGLSPQAAAASRQALPRPIAPDTMRPA